MTTLVRHDLTDPAIPEGMVRIVLGSSYRFIWPVHLGGWQSLGWQLQPAADLTAPEPRLPEPELELELKPELDPDLAPDPDPEEETDQDLEQGSESDVTEPMSLAAGTELPSAPDGADSLSAPLGATFQAMTKAQILEHCSSVYGVELDGSQTKAELIEQASSLESQNALTAAAGSGPEPLLQPESAEPLPDGLSDELLDAPLI